MWPVPHEFYSNRHEGCGVPEAFLCVKQKAPKAGASDQTGWRGGGSTI